jgi:uncharacterized protein (TIGR03546 family)
MITLLAKLIKTLNSDDNPSQIALAVVFASIMGLTPLNSLHNIFILLLVLVIRVNITMFVLALGVFTLFAYAFDPLSHQLGLLLLQADALEGLWTSLYQSSFWRLLSYNNTLVLGSLVLSLLLSPVIFFVSRIFIIQYRQRVMTWIQKSHIGLWFKSSKFISIYQTLQD